MAVREGSGGEKSLDAARVEVEVKGGDQEEDIEVGGKDLLIPGLASGLAGELVGAGENALDHGGAAPTVEADVEQHQIGNPFEDHLDRRRRFGGRANHVVAVGKGFPNAHQHERVIFDEKDAGALLFVHGNGTQISTSVPDADPDLIRTDPPIASMGSMIEWVMPPPNVAVASKPPPRSRTFTLTPSAPTSANRSISPVSA